MADIETEAWKRWLARLIDRGGKDGPKKESAASSRTLIILILIGIGLMLLGQRLTDEAAVPSDAPAQDEAAPVIADPADAMKRLERELMTAISKIAGVENAEVLIVPASSEVRVFAEEITQRSSVTQSAAQSGTGRVETREESITRKPVIIRGEDGRIEQALVSHTERGKIAGVLVTAAGAEDPRVRLMLLEAVSTALDVPPHRVQIVARKR